MVQKQQDTLVKYCHNEIQLIFMQICQCRDQFIMTLCPIHWAPVQEKGSNILCVKLSSKKPKKAQNSFKWLKIAPNSFKWVQICLTGSHWVQKRTNWSKWIQMGPNGSKWIHMGGYLLQYIPGHLLNLFLNGSWDYNITLSVFHSISGNKNS